MELRRKSTRRLILLGLVCLVVASAATIVAATEIMRGHNASRAMLRLDASMRVANHLLHDLGDNPRVEDGKLLIGNTVLNDNDHLVDTLTDLVGGHATLFQGDHRVATTIRNQAGNRIIGTTLADPPAHDAVFQRHQPFRGIVNVMSVPYFAGYDPLFNETGELVGALFVGLPVQPFIAGVDSARNLLILVTTGTAGMVGILFLIIGNRYEKHINTRERSLEVANAHLDTALDNMANGLALWDADRRLILFNKRMAAITGIPPTALHAGMPIREFLAELKRAGAFEGQSLEDVVERNKVLGRERRPRRFLQRYAGNLVEVGYSPVPGGGHLISFEDVTERKRAEERINFMAWHDALTGLPNRVLFHERLTTALASKEKFALIIIDLDRFKEVNDTLGHPVGDGLLRNVAARLREVAGPADTVGRLGGDEFALIHHGANDEPTLRRTATTIAARISEPYDMDGYQVTVGASLGLAIATPGVDPDVLNRQADMALYRAKSEGRDRFCFFEPGMAEALIARRQLEADLREAVQNQSLTLAYQPIVSLKTGQVSALEALLRWDHPTSGPIPAATFIPIAEESGLIIPLGAWVMHRACADLVAWDRPVKVAVNLSTVQFRDIGLVDMVRQALRDTGLPPERLEIEITESVLIQDTARTNAILRELRALGIHVCMDDFGTGYSSMSYLSTFVFDTIKIDRAFTADLGISQYATAIVTAVVGLAQTLGITTVAEGVETDEQRAWLFAEGCLAAQGYLFSKPVPAQEVPALLATLGAAAQGGRPSSRPSPAPVSI